MVNNKKKYFDRVLYIDNLKGLMIVSVVLMHYLGTGIVYTSRSNYFFDAVYAFNAAINMPLFCFISGFLSKDLLTLRSKTISRYLFLYLFFNILFVYLDGHNLLRAIYPYGVLWFLFALIIWRLLLVDLVKVKFILPISICVALISKFIFSSDQTMIIKILSFTPYFLWGYYSSSDFIRKIRSFDNVVTGKILFITFVMTIMFTKLNIIHYISPLYATSLKFNSEGLNWLLGEFISVGVGVVTLICLINLVDNKKNEITRIGVSSMTIFLLHSFPHLRDFLSKINPFPELFMLNAFYWISLTIISVGILSSTPVSNVFNKFVSLLVIRKDTSILHK